MDIGSLAFPPGFSSQRGSKAPGGADDAAASFSKLLEDGKYLQGARWIARESPLPEDVHPVDPGAEPEYFLDHLVAGHKEGLPVIEETPAEEAKAVDDLLNWAASRGQNLEETTFIKGNIPVFDGPTGPKIGYRIVTAMSLPMPPLCQDGGVNGAMPDA